MAIRRFTDSGELVFATLCKFRMNAFHSLIIKVAVSAALVSAVSANSEVKVSSSSYRCCEDAPLQFDPTCETTLASNGMSVAYLNGESSQWKPPCTKTEDGPRPLYQCPNVTATTVCTDENNVTTEERVNYYGQPYSHAAPAHQGSVGLMLLSVVMAGWSVK